MKIRIRGNSIRLRLQRSEVADFAQRNRIEDSIQFNADTKITYSLIGSEQAHTLDAMVRDNAISVTVPLAQGLEWANGDQVGMEDNKKLDSGDTLRILVEKDFQCLSPRAGEDESDMYTNPNENCSFDP